MQRFNSVFGRLAAVVTATAALVLAPVSSPASGEEATQISGIGFLNFGKPCYPKRVGADFAIHMVEGDLLGCHYVFVEDGVCSESGTYREWGTEMFVGWYNGGFGTFETTYLFTAKLEDCDLSAEIFGRCQHPIVEGSGTGVFDGVTGRIDIKDDIETGELFYRGHLQW
ncbi:MAG: hypothetical protein ACYTG0_37375 [Planctomycetota bacterium]|jgi:hypothetical protein